MRTARAFEPQTYPARVASATKRAVQRLEFIDVARGLAVVLMILSHGVKGLLSFEQFPVWGLVPIHLVTKFSSSLFLLVFGICLAAIYVPAAGGPDWPRRRTRLLWRGIELLFWYKLLTIVEMFRNNKPDEIMQTLAYKNFPVYVEILGFYGLALLWLPWALPLWKRTPMLIKLAVPAATIFISSWVSAKLQLMNLPGLQAILVEHDDFYTWGQLSRAPLIFSGLILGELMTNRRYSWISKNVSWAALFAGTGAALFTGFLIVSWPSIGEALRLVALNKGKHPPELGFMLFSLSGAFLILSFCVAGGRDLAKTLRPVTWIGRDAMGAFIAHVVILFVVYRYLFDLWLKVSYMQALGLALLMIAVTAVWLRLKEAVK